MELIQTNTLTVYYCWCRYIQYGNAFLCRFGSGSGQIWLDNVGCTGNESCLLSCANLGIGSHNCGHFEDVAIFCSGARNTTTDCSSILDIGKFVAKLYVIQVTKYVRISTQISMLCKSISSNRNFQPTSLP